MKQAKKTGNLEVYILDIIQSKPFGLLTLFVGAFCILWINLIGQYTSTFEMTGIVAFALFGAQTKPKFKTLASIVIPYLLLRDICENHLDMSKHTPALLVFGIMVISVVVYVLCIIEHEVNLLLRYRRLRKSKSITNG